MVDLLHAYIDAGFTETIVYVPADGDPIRAAEIVAAEVLREIVRPRP